MKLQQAKRIIRKREALECTIAAKQAEVDAKEAIPLSNEQAIASFTRRLDELKEETYICANALALEQEAVVKFAQTRAKRNSLRREVDCLLRQLEKSKDALAEAKRVLDEVKQKGVARAARIIMIEAELMQRGIPEEIPEHIRQTIRGHPKRRSELAARLAKEESHGH